MITKILIGLLVLIVAAFIAIAFGGKGDSKEARVRQKISTPVETVKGHRSDDNEEDDTEGAARQVVKITEGEDDLVTINVDYNPAFNYFDYDPPEEYEDQPAEGGFNKEFWEKWDREAFSETPVPVMEKFGDDLVRSGVIEKESLEAMRKSEKNPAPAAAQEMPDLDKIHEHMGVFSEVYRILPFDETEPIVY